MDNNNVEKFIKELLKEMSNESAYTYRLIDKYKIRVSVMENDEHALITGYNYSSLMMALLKWYARNI